MSDIDKIKEEFDKSCFRIGKGALVMTASNAQRLIDLTAQATRERDIDFMEDRLLNYGGFEAEGGFPAKYIRELKELKKEMLARLRYFDWEEFFGVNSRAQKSVEKVLIDAIDRSAKLARSEALKEAAEVARNKNSIVYNPSVSGMSVSIGPADKGTCEAIATAIEALDETPKDN